MNIRDITPRDIVKMAWDVLPQKDDTGGSAFVVVNTKNGRVFGVYEPGDRFVYNPSEDDEVIFILQFGNKVVGSKAELLSDWFLDEEDRSEENMLNLLHKRFKNEICCSLLDIKEKYPHLV